MRDHANPRRWRAVVCFSVLALLVVSAGQSAGYEPTPSPDLSPSDVVHIQVEALRSGRIDIVFRFASPQNKASTGPLPRFTEMLQSPTYLAMLHHRSAMYGPLRKEGGQAYQTVIVVPPGGEAVGYVFVLSKSYSDACDGCWMTDSVSRFEPEQKMRGT